MLFVVYVAFKVGFRYTLPLPMPNNNTTTMHPAKSPALLGQHSLSPSRSLQSVAHNHDTLIWIKLFDQTRRTNNSDRSFSISDRVSARDHHRFTYLGSRLCLSYNFASSVVCTQPPYPSTGKVQQHNWSIKHCRIETIHAQDNSPSSSSSSACRVKSSALYSPYISPSV